MISAFDIAVTNAVAEARRCPKAFAEYVGFTCEGFHAELQDLWTENDRTVVYAPVSAGKSVQSTLRLLWDIGTNPNAKIAFISATEGLGTNIVSTLRSYIKDDPRVHKVFPGLRMSTSQALDTTDSFRIERPDRGPDPTFKVFGVGAGEIQGARLTHVIADDVATFANSQTEASRKKVVAWFQSAVLTRAAVEGLQVRVLANPHHQESLPEVFGKLDGWKLLRRGAEDDGRLLAPEVMCRKQIAKKRAELGPFASAMIDALTPRAGASMFTDEGIERCLRAGEGLSLVASFPRGAASVFSGVDIGGGVGRDRSAITTIAILADGARRVLDVRSGDWSGTVLVEQMRDVHRAYGGVMGVESNAVQGLIADMASDVPTQKIVTDAHLKRFGLLAFAHEVESGQWLIPSHGGEPAHAQVAELIAGMRTYSPSSHASDALMSALIAREVAARAFDVLADYEGAADAEEDWLANEGIFASPEERRFRRRGYAGWMPIEHMGGN